MPTSKQSYSMALRMLKAVDDDRCIHRQQHTLDTTNEGKVRLRDKDKTTVTQPRYDTIQFDHETYL